MMEVNPVIEAAYPASRRKPLSPSKAPWGEDPRSAETRVLAAPWGTATRLRGDNASYEFFRDAPLCPPSLRAAASRRFSGAPAYLHARFAAPIAALRADTATEWLRSTPPQEGEALLSVARAFQHAQPVLAAVALVSASLTSGAHFSGQVVLAVPGLVACHVGATLAKAAHRQLIRYEQSDVGALMASL
jgi:hypothetical protein